MAIKRQGQALTPNLRKRFFLWSALILLSGGLLLSAFTYWNTRRLLMNEAMARSEVILREAEAIRSYVHEELRPKMYELKGRDAFIIEAMSTTYVSTRIMARFAESMPDYVYRRVSLNPHNPLNMADPFEEKMFDWFGEDTQRSFWQGVVRKNGDSFFISMVPDYFTDACIRCHGNADDAPQPLLDRYGRDGGFRFKAGDLGGINSVSVPVSASLRRAWQGSLIVFIVSIFGSCVLLWLLNFLFQRLVIERLGTMLSLVAEKEKRNRQGGTGDEIDELHASLGSLTRYVRSAQKGAYLEPNFIGDYIVTEPVCAGTLSWLYHGRSSTSRDRAVSIKLGYADVQQNPLYRACLETEFQLFEGLSHPCLPTVIERVDDALIMESIHGQSLVSVLGKGRLDHRLLVPLFSRLCSLTAHLHANGIVHHDLRPHILMLDKEEEVRLIDMGLAASDRQADPIVAAGLGPQGDFLYMAPEQIRGKRGDSRSDIYTIGVLLYHAATGRLPVTENKRSIKGWLKEKARFISSGQYRDGSPSALEPVIKRALSFDIQDRYHWVEDLQEDLDTAFHMMKK